MISEEEQKAVYGIVELIYEMYIKDLKSGNAVNPIKSFGKILRKKGLINNDNLTLFDCGK